MKVQVLLQGINARKILLMIGIMAAHAFGEGAGVGVSFCGSRGWAQVAPIPSLCAAWLQRRLCETYPESP